MFRELSIDQISDKSKRFPVVDGPFGTQLHADEYVNDGLPVVRITNLSYSGKFSITDLVFVNENKYKKLIRSEVLKDDIIIAKTGATIGKSALFPLERGIIASSCLKVSLNKKIVDPVYLISLITSFDGQRKIIDGASGSTRTTINIEPFKKLKFNFPELDEQKRIFDILCEADRAINHTEELIAKYQRIKTGLMQDLLTRGIDENGNIRSKATHKFVVKNGIEVPEEWNVDIINNLVTEVLDFKANGSFENLTKNVKYYYEQNYARLIRLTDLRNGLKNEGVYIDEKGFQYLKKTRLVEGDILISCVGEYTGFVCQMPKVAYQATIAPNMFVVRFKQEYCNSFIAKYMTSSFFQKEVGIISTSSATKLLNNPNLRSLRIVLPRIDEQIVISEKLEIIDDTINMLHYNLHKLHKIKTGLMQDLLSGRVRVPEGMVK